MDDEKTVTELGHEADEIVHEIYINMKKVQNHSMRLRDVLLKNGLIKETWNKKDHFEKNSTFHKALIKSIALGLSEDPSKHESNYGCGLISDWHLYCMTSFQFERFAVENNLSSETMITLKKNKNNMLNFLYRVRKVIIKCLVEGANPTPKKLTPKTKAELKQEIDDMMVAPDIPSNETTPNKTIVHDTPVMVTNKLRNRNRVHYEEIDDDDGDDSNDDGDDSNDGGELNDQNFEINRDLNENGEFDDNADNETVISEVTIEFNNDHSNLIVVQSPPQKPRSRFPRQLPRHQPADQFFTGWEYIKFLMGVILKTFAKTAIIYDPCCGENHILNGMAKYGYSNFISRDKHHRNENQKIDFLDDTVQQPNYDLAVVNPPFCLKEQFLSKLYSIGKPFVFLMPLDCICYVGIGNLLKENHHAFGWIHPHPHKNFIYNGVPVCGVRCCWVFCNFEGFSVNKGESCFLEMVEPDA